MIAEVLTDSQMYAGFPRHRIISKREAVKELECACGSFKSPFTFEEKVRIFLSQKVHESDILGNVTQVIAGGEPLNWTLLLRYLRQNNIIAEPHFVFNYIRNDFPPLYSVSLQVPRDEKRTDGLQNLKGTGLGHGKSIDVVISKTVGELLERHFLTLYERKNFIRSSYDSLRKKDWNALDISNLNEFLPAKKNENARYDRNAQSPLYWVKGEMADGQVAYIPAQLVHWNYDFSRDTEEPILIDPTTNGEAGGFTKKAAILSALLETIERDGFLIYWLNSISPRIVDMTLIKDDEVRDMLAEMRRYGIEAYFLNTTSDIGIPSITCTLVDRRIENDPIIALGGSAGFTIKDTVLHSAYEALSVLHSVVNKESFVLPENYRPFMDKQVGRSERLALWRGKKMLDAFSFFISGTMQSPEDFLGNASTFVSVEARLDHTLTQLKKLGRGYEVYLYEVRSRILQTIGYYVVKVIVPQLISLYLRETEATLGAKRLREVPRSMGFKAAETLNPWPHPFP